MNETLELLHGYTHQPKPSRRECRIVTITFDGGTPCNIPRLGYGIGYGSYEIDDQPVARCDHGRPMSANAAEILTLVRAVQSVVAKYGRETTALRIFGDSQIALKWASGRTRNGKPAKLGKGGSEEYRNAIQTLRDALKGFPHVETQWQPRAKSVALFGH